MGSNKKQYFIKLNTGRILGPLNLFQVSEFIDKKVFQGTELVSNDIGASKDWKPISAYDEISVLFEHVGHFALTPSSEDTQKQNAIQGGDETLILPESEQAEGSSQSESSKSGYKREVELPTAMNGFGEGNSDETLLLPPTAINISAEGLESAEQADKNVNQNLNSEYKLSQDQKSFESDSEKTSVEKITEVESEPNNDDKTQVDAATVEWQVTKVFKNIFNEKTVFFQKSTSINKKKKKKKESLKTLIMVLVAGLAAYELFFEKEVKKPTLVRVAPVRAVFPTYEGKVDSKTSDTLYKKGMEFYVLDTLSGYKEATRYFLKSAALDINNIKAKAMLASSYLNLIDASNKDDNYFAVITKLIDQARSNAIDLPELLIADVEFYVLTDKPDAAQNRIVEYTKIHQKFGIEMFYYLSYAFFYRGNYQDAYQYLQNIPNDRAFSARVPYLRGLILEKLGQLEGAVAEFEFAVKMNKDHARSRVRIADILSKSGRPSLGRDHLEYIVSHPKELPYKELGLGFYLHSQLLQSEKKYDLALGDIERAVKLDPENHDYLLEMYTLRHLLGDNNPKVKIEAQMYYYLSEGEKLYRQGKRDEALISYLSARQVMDKSPLPLVKIGEMFLAANDMVNARDNFKLAADRAPEDIQVWTKYINVLIDSFEWEEAMKAMEKFRKLPVSQSAVDKAAGDLYAKQSRWNEAFTHYKKAMSRETIDSTVYLAFAKVLLATKNFKDAPFFYSLARRYDPANSEVVIGVAKSIAGLDGLDAGINYLKNELTVRAAMKPQLLAAIAELEIQKGEWTNAQALVDQAMQADPTYAYPWKLQAQIYLNGIAANKEYWQKAADAFKSYSERNKSDVTGYIERYKLFVRRSDFEAAKSELIEITTVYPKYPNLHYYLGALYSVMGNHKIAVEEFRIELRNNPNGVNTILALGKELVEVGEIKEAHSLFQKAMQIAPDASEPKHWTGYTSYLMRNFQGAIALYQSALLSDTGNSLIYKRLGLALREVGDLVAARSAFQRYLEMEPDAPDRGEVQQWIQ